MNQTESEKTAHSPHVEDEQDPDNWRQMEDPQERRKSQNRLAQRRYRNRRKIADEERAQISANKDAAASAYASTDPDDLKANDNPSGLPWGSIDIRGVVERGKAKEQQSQASGPGSNGTGAAK